MKIHVIKIITCRALIIVKHVNIMLDDNAAVKWSPEEEDPIPELNDLRNYLTREDEETEDEEELLNEIKVKTDEGALNHFAGYAARRVSQ